MWGLGYPLNKIGLKYTSPTNYIELRFVIATIAMFIIVIASRNFVIPKLRDLPIVIAVSFFQIVLTMNLSNFGLSLVDAGKATFIVFTTSIWLIPLSALLNRRLSRMDRLALGIGTVGVIFLISPWEIHWGDTQTWIGDISLLMASLFWSIGILCARHMKWHRSSLQLLPWQLLFASFCTIIFAYVRGVDFKPDQLNFILIGTLVYSGALSIAIGYWAMILVSKNLSPSIVSLGLIFVPIVSLIFSVIFLNEVVSRNLIVAVIFIIAGVLLHIYSERKSKKHIQLYEKL
jgi:drug/metabolite transporter (DMT)-like permease